MKKQITATAVEKMRRWAKKHARDESSLSYSQALEQASRDAGFASWHEVQEALKASAPAAGEFDLPVDPKLPPNFEHTANESRSKAELDRWWLRPFAQRRPDGSLEVRCLDGGAWDRPTYYGVAKDLDEAREIARAKLSHWQEMRDTPAAQIGDPAHLLTLEPNRPGMPRPVLSAAGTYDDLHRVQARWQDTLSRDPQAAQVLVRAIRDRSARVPTYDQAERAAATAEVAYPDGSRAGLQEVALLLAVHAFGGQDATEVQFTLPELAHYLWEFGMSQTNIEEIFARAQHLRIREQPAIAATSKISRDGVAHWTVRLNPNNWTVSRRPRKR